MRRSASCSSRTSTLRRAYAVGYASATQFSRDYKKLFGTPPKKSVRVMKNHVTPEGVPMS